MLLKAVVSDVSTDLVVLSMSSAPGKVSPPVFLILCIKLLTKPSAFRRWCFYMLIIWVGVLLIAIFLLVPETYHPMYVFFVLANIDVWIVILTLEPDS